MTEEQIIKAFEHCNILHKCDNCPSLRDGGRVCLTPDIDKQLKKKCKDINTARKIIKSEAIKEFAENLKEEMRLDDDCNYDCAQCHYDCKDYISFIDNLVKEMTKEE